ncbi:tRNA (adenosine(37)-N6)-dimethylallyltransferase MiaA [Arthrobacter russicus]
MPEHEPPHVTGPSGGEPGLIAVVGPTGTGKSELGLQLAEELGGEIINADSMQFYRGMDIGTAKLPLAERRGVPHHLMDTLEITEEASVARFQAEARQAIADIRARGLHPILLGGSGLYVRAVLDVLEFPGTDPKLRRRLDAELQQDGAVAFRARLRAVDPESEQRIGDYKRLVRALEVYELTGRPFSSFMPKRQYFQPALQIGLNGDRGVLHDRLARRVDTMVEQGLLAEVRTLAGAGLRAGRTACRALGYQQFLRVLDEAGYSTADAAADTVVATRQFARRQSTWFNADPRISWLDFADPDLLRSALARIRPG